MNRRLTIGLVVVFAALVVYTLVVQAPKDNAANATATVVPQVYLLSLQADKVTGVHVVDRVTGKSMDLVKDSAGVWSLTQPGPQPAEQALAAADVTSLQTLAVNGTITTSTDLASFGVLSPTLTVEVDLSDGTKVKAVVGDKVPTGSDYYALRDGETNVVLLSSAAQGTLASLVSAPPVVPPTATPTLGPGTPSVTPSLTATVTVTATATLATSTPLPTATLPASATSTVQPATATLSATETTAPDSTATAVPKSSATP